MPKYQLHCLGTEDRIEDAYTVRYHDTALLRTEYDTSSLTPRDEPGLWRWVDWLPVSMRGSQTAGSICYRSQGLADALGLANLWISFHGFWPERAADCPTTTFKDMEAVTTLQRLRDHDVPGLICASAGNTARAFAHFGGLDAYPILLVVAEKHLGRLWVPKGHPVDSVSIIGIKDGDYNDAIEVTSRILEVGGWRREGGVHNVARRDGIGSLILTATEAIGQLPTHYFQGVGGGPGPIGVHEMALRAIEAGFADGPVPQIHLSQNDTFSPIHDAWKAGNRTLERIPDTIHPRVFSDYLVNRAPAYAVTGGLFDMLTESQGDTWAVSYEEAAVASQLFEATEGIDVMSPAAVALASLQQAITTGRVGRDEVILLNVSGGGQRRYRDEVPTEVIPPVGIVSKDEAVLLGREIVR
ncbi:MAG: cysteate synthase [Rhodothermales bacterium]